MSDGGISLFTGMAGMLGGELMWALILCLLLSIMVIAAFGMTAGVGMLGVLLFIVGNIYPDEAPMLIYIGLIIIAWELYQFLNGAWNR